MKIENKKREMKNNLPMTTFVAIIMFFFFIAALLLGLHFILIYEIYTHLLAEGACKGAGYEKISDIDRDKSWVNCSKMVSDYPDLRYETKWVKYK